MKTKGTDHDWQIGDVFSYNKQLFIISVDAGDGHGVVRRLTTIKPKTKGCRIGDSNFPADNKHYSSYNYYENWNQLIKILNKQDTVKYIFNIDTLNDTVNSII